nr:MAG TPA: hypothetical protein [Caudoviricetes sp.]DAR41175.1 MAG TPA: hypothetical protein [Caudoviricetes sp.]
MTSSQVHHRVYQYMYLTLVRYIQEYMFSFH